VLHSRLRLALFLQKGKEVLAEQLAEPVLSSTDRQIRSLVRCPGVSVRSMRRWVKRAKTTHETLLPKPLVNGRCLRFPTTGRGWSLPPLLSMFSS
jgi:hypothetical protein